MDDITAAVVGAFDALLAQINFASPEGAFRSFILLLACSALALFAITATLKALAKLIDSLVSFGFGLPARGAGRPQRRQRQHFCLILEADLVNLSRTESWNDYHFAELDIELEIAGPYASTVIDRLLGARRSGTRRLPSLEGALQRCGGTPVLMVGEPGSGKSVALRHLAHTILSRHRRRLSDRIPVPLYINLRDFAAPTGPLDAMAVKQFVFDNVRRGDSDTVAFLKQNWDEFIRQGRWMFLFDSFDEIPAVLTAAEDAPIVAQYGEALRQFLNGAPKCRSVVATRSYRCPRALGAAQVTLLPLSKAKKTQLIKNALATSDQIAAALSYLERPEDRLSHNPMLLSLLCRRIRDSREVHGTEYSIVTDHLSTLAQRDSDYFSRKHGVSPDELLAAAVAIARTMATNTQLGLSPSVASLTKALQVPEINEDHLDKLLTVMVEAKIGRFDVPGAKRGERRFAFAHRRYQEALVAAAFEKTLDKRKAIALLLQESDFEYSVALLQTGTLETIVTMCQAAQEVLAGSDSDYVSLGSSAGRALRYYNWRGSKAAHVLRQLQHGCHRRMGEMPSAVLNVAGEFLKRRWATGDQVDRFMVLQYAALMHPPVVASMVSEALVAPEIALREAGYRAGGALSRSDERITREVRKCLFWELLASDTEEELLRVKAWALRMPRRLAAMSVVRRATVFRLMLAPIRLYEGTLTLPATLIQTVLSRRWVPVDPLISLALSLVRRREWSRLSVVLSIGTSALVGLGLFTPFVFSSQLSELGSRQALNVFGDALLGTSTGALLSSCALLWTLMLVAIVAEVGDAGWRRRRGMARTLRHILTNVALGVASIAAAACAISLLYAGSLVALSQVHGREPKLADVMIVMFVVFEAVAITYGIRSGSRFIKARNRLERAAASRLDSVDVAISCERAIDAAVVLDVASRMEAKVRSHKLRTLGRILLDRCDRQPHESTRATIAWLEAGPIKHLHYARWSLGQCSSDYGTDDGEGLGGQEVLDTRHLGPRGRRS